MSLAVKYRPKDFESMVWQTFVRETLTEAIKENKLVGAYLFCGPRGTGKTSVARILAKTINCLNPKDGNPCHTCEICQNISEWKLIDIIEIDAASHTGVDNIRDIIEKAQFVPNKAKYKVYIIDEVHMLSTWAFNALLKILEEPPSFVKFILATTEIHKIPETILSRCQRYDFKNISDNDLEIRLSYIAKEENIKIEKEALDFIIKNAHWWLRNAITLFEQYIINNEILYQNIIKNLWIIETWYLKEFYNKLLNKDKSIVDDFYKVVENGKNIKLFFKDLIYLVRDEILENIKNDKSIVELNFILDLLDETYTKTKNSMDEKITLLSWLLKVITRGECVANFSSWVIKNEPLNIEKIQKISSSDFSSEWQKKIIDSSKNQGVQNKTKSEFESFDVCDIEIDAVMDIFWEDWVDESKSTTGIKSSWSVNNTNFSKEDLVSKIKELWWKWWIIMWLKGWSIVFNWNDLYVKTPSKIALKSFQDTWSKELILQAMSEMWYNEIWLKIE